MRQIRRATGYRGGSQFTLSRARRTRSDFALIDHLRSIDKRRIRRVFGELAREEIAAIDEGLALFLGIGDRLHGPDAPPVQ